MSGPESRQQGSTGSVDALGPEVLREALHGLDLELRLAVCLCFDLGLGPDETAAVLDVPVGTATARAQEGLRRMHHLLAARGLERLPDEIAADLGAMPRPPVPASLLRSLERLVAAQDEEAAARGRPARAEPLGEGRVS